MRRWQEAEWRYEKRDDLDLSSLDWGAEREPSPHRLLRHEAEYWDFRPDGVLEISRRDGKKLRARWLLKGRGHVLELRGQDGRTHELYEIKELSKSELVLHYDIGMEVRGIARLSFRSLAGGESGSSS